MPRIQTTKSVKVALLILRIYLLGMLVLILLKFFVFTGNPQPTPAQPASAPASTTTPTTTTAPTTVPR